MLTSKTPLMSLLRRAYHLATIAAEAKAAPANELVDQFLEQQSRRAFLRSSGRAALLAGGLTTLNACQPDELTPQSPGKAARQGGAGPSLAIVGGGIAGLHAAHILTKRGFTNFTIYEAANQTGGRIRTAKNLLAPGLTTELGGEFIDSGHGDMLRLADEFGLPLLDLESPSETALIKDAYFFNGRLYSLAEVVAAFRPIAGQIRADIQSLPDVLDYTTNGGPGLRFDRLSITEYLNQIGATGLIRSLLLVAYETEFGLSCDVQTSINLLTLISPRTADGQFNVFGASDERYKIAGGNQQITDRLTQLYQDDIRTGAVLQGIGKEGSKYVLRFNGHATVRADLVLLTVPFSKLRQVDIDVNLTPRKRRAINQLDYGTNAKLFLGFTNRPWRSLGYTGYVFSDNGVQSGWDNAQLQPGTAGGFTVYTGGSRGVQLGTGSPAQQAQQYLPKLNQIFPGATGRYNWRAERFQWPTYPFTLGSYACYTVGQKTNFGGAEGESDGNLFFAGEHCSADFQGYMNGGAETGRKAAKEILQLVTV